MPVFNKVKKAGKFLSTVAHGGKLFDVYLAHNTVVTASYSNGIMTAERGETYPETHPMHGILAYVELYLINS